jgi:acetaldehyde dehydrogenase (acetylating)
MESLERAVAENPAMVEIDTPAGFLPEYAGSLDKMPTGVTYFARQGKVSASFTRAGKTVMINRTAS